MEKQRYNIFRCQTGVCVREVFMGWEMRPLHQAVKGTDLSFLLSTNHLGRSLTWKALEFKEPWCWLCLKTPSIILCLTASPNTPVIGVLVFAAPAGRVCQPWQPGAAPGWQHKPLSCSFSHPGWRTGLSSASILAKVWVGFAEIFWESSSLYWRTQG